MTPASQLHDTESICPVCFARLPAERRQQGDEVFQVKECAEHGAFSTLIWRGEPALDGWRRDKPAVHPQVCYGSVDKGCPYDCGLCPSHEQMPCSVLLEVTERCNLQCAVCFADAGCSESSQDPSLESLTRLLEKSMAAAGPCNLQISGGEPTLRDDLPEIVALARRIGYTFIQINTNGIRLADDPALCRRLADAGVSALFLQFDGVDDDIYLTLRGSALLERKRRAIVNAGAAGIGVVLVPTVVRGVNSSAVAAIVREALDHAPVVRGVHFQPVSYFGRFTEAERSDDRFTLPELMRCLEQQSGGLLKAADFAPPGGEHAHCSFHATYLYSADGTLRLLGTTRSDCCCSPGNGAAAIRTTVDTVSRRWKLPSGLHDPLQECCRPTAVRTEGDLDLDDFLRDVAVRSFTISAMAFQDAHNLDLERLKGCCISIIAADGRLVPFCAYNIFNRSRPSP